MFGRRRVKLGRKSRAAEVVDLVRVYLQLEAHSGRGFKQPAALFDGEDPLFAEDVAEARNTLGLDLREHFFDEYFVDELIRIRFIFRRHGVRAHEGWRDGERGLFRYALYYAEHFELGLRIQPVAALYLYRRCALGKSRQHRAFAAPEKLLFVRFLHRVHGRENAAAAREYLQVGEPCEAHTELVFAALRETDVRVWVDEAGYHAGSAEILFERDVAAAYPFRHFVLRADALDDAVGNEHRSVLKFAYLSLFGARKSSAIIDGGEEAHVSVKLFHLIRPFRS